MAAVLVSPTDDARRYVLPRAKTYLQPYARARAALPGYHLYSLCLCVMPLLFSTSSYILCLVLSITSPASCLLNVSSYMCDRLYLKEEEEYISVYACALLWHGMFLLLPLLLRGRMGCDIDGWRVIEHVVKGENKIKLHKTC